MKVASSLRQALGTPSLCSNVRGVLILYEHPLSPYARKVKLALFEKHLDFERRHVGPRELDSEEFRQISPRSEVPVLVDDGTVVFDSTVICEYLEERCTDPRLLPNDPKERARVRLLEEVADTSLEAALWALFEVHYFTRASGALAERLVAEATTCIERHFDRLERELASKPFLNGDLFGLADIAFVPHVAGAAQSGIKPGPKRPRLSDWVKRIRARDSVKRDAEQVRVFMATVAEEAALARDRPRQYRSHRVEWMLKHGGLSVVLDGIDKGTIQFSADL